MKKQTKVLVAAAMLTLGASFTSMAATYDWQIEDGQWVCYDEDGEVYEDEWVESNGKDYYVGDDGIMVTSQWIDGVYVDSTGAKTTNAWKYILPEDGDEDEDEAEWFYFGSNGTPTIGKKVINEKTYYFDSETGIMLTGWVNYGGKNDTAAATGYDKDETVYCGEDGARVSNAWVEEYEPGTTDDEKEDADTYWYYIQSKGTPKTGRALDINGETYFFDAEAKMLSNWVATTNGDAFFNLADRKETITDLVGDEVNVYFCGDSDQGWAKKSTWVNEYASDIYKDADSDDNDMNWFWFDDKGRMHTADKYVASEMTFADGAAEAYDEQIEVDTDATTVAANTKTINGKKYAFNQDGVMLSGLVKIDGKLYYFGDAEDGSMKTGEVTLEDAEEEDAYTFYFAKNDKDGYLGEGVAVTGAAAGDLYIGGILQTHDDDYKQYTVTVDGKTLYFIIDGDGDIKSSKKQYKDDDDKVYLDTTKTGNEFESKGAKKGGFTVNAIVE